MNRNREILTFFNKSYVRFLLLSSAYCLMISSYNLYSSSNAQQEGIPGIGRLNTESEDPYIKDPLLKAEVVVDGLEFPTTMAFAGPEDILVLEKQKGTVRRIVDDNLLDKPLLDVNVNALDERGMLGIAVMHNISSPDAGHHSHDSAASAYVFLYYTEAQSRDGVKDEDEDNVLGNRLYRYRLVNNTLIDPKLLLELPAYPSPEHNGGAITIGPDNNIYLAVGDLEGDNGGWLTLAQNYPHGINPDGRAGILRVTPNGDLVNSKGILGDEHPLDLYYAYGVRNSFGMDFDPLTGNLWDTENGPNYGDEINLVEPGFNSGWGKVEGMARPNSYSLDTNKLVDFGGRGKYSNPEFVWNSTVGPTAIKFLDSDRLGNKYQNDAFVGDVTTGNIYRFDLGRGRADLQLEGELDDKIADDRLTGDEDVIFGRNFAGISDIEVGPHDGYLYIVSIGDGKIYRIIPSSNVP
jgi:aldose sugar dehydrogenase